MGPADALVVLARNTTEYFSKYEATAKRWAAAQGFAHYAPISHDNCSYATKRRQDQAARREQLNLRAKPIFI